MNGAGGSSSSRVEDETRRMELELEAMRRTLQERESELNTLKKAKSKAAVKAKGGKATKKVMKKKALPDPK